MLVANRRLFVSNEPSCSLPFSCVLPKEGLRADFAIATRMLCHRSALCWAMQYDSLRFLPFQPCRGRTLLFSYRSVPLSQEPSSLSTFRQSCSPFYSTLVQIRCGLHPADRYIAPVWPSFWHFHPSRLCKFHEKTPLLPSKALFRG